MDIKSKVFKRKSGKSKGRWIARVSYFDESSGMRRTVERTCSRRTDATDERNRIEAEIAASQGQSRLGNRMSFDQLVDRCELIFYRPAIIVEGRKVAGVRSIESVRSHLKNLRQFFGSLPLKEISPESLTSYKIHRIKPTSPSARPVKIATVNRELSTMRAMFRFALQKGWVIKDIFYNSRIIEVSGEVARTRVLSREEEKRLLQCCTGERRITYIRNGKTVTASNRADNPHLRAIILLALDSGLRRGEILKLRWSDIDFELNVITVVGTHTKTEQTRIAPLSSRTKDELLGLIPSGTSERPFPFMHIKRSFCTAKRIAEIEDLRFHDLRRTAITRWIQEGTSLPLAGKFAGHSQLQTTAKHYIATDLTALQALNERIDRAQES